MLFRSKINKNAVERDVYWSKDKITNETCLNTIDQTILKGKCTRIHDSIGTYQLNQDQYPFNYVHRSSIIIIKTMTEITVGICNGINWERFNENREIF